MSQQYDNNMRGVLFKNDRKESDRHPDYKGSAEVDETEYWVSAWIKEGRNGKFLSMSFTEKEEDRPAPPPSRPTKTPQRQQSDSRRQGFDDMDDDIPF